MDDPKMQLHRQLAEDHAKYTYFLMAISASCIALSVQRTTGVKPNAAMSILALAVIFWGASIYFGCRVRILVQQAIYNNLRYLNEEDQTFRELANVAYDHAKICGVRQFLTLITGAALFLVWHVLSMFL